MAYDINVMKAEPGFAQSIAELYKKVWGGNYRLKEFTDPKSVAKEIQRPDRFWYVAESEGRLVGSTVGTMGAWMTCELGRTVVDAQYNGIGIAKSLCDHMNAAAVKAGAEVLWGSCRNNSIFRIAQGLGLQVTGYLPGAHVAKEREIILMVLGFANNALSKRVVSAKKDIYALAGVQNVASKLGISLKGDEGPYPLDLVVNAGTQDNLVLSGAYDSSEKSLILTDCRGDWPCPEYLEATVLVDKSDEIFRAIDSGWNVVAFLPAWFENEGKRYDCVKIAKPIVQPILKTLDFRPILDDLVQGFQFPKSPTVPITPANTSENG